MRARCDPSAELLRLADAQAGVLTREQAQDSGLPSNAVSRLVRQGQWRRIARGVFVIGSPTWTSWAWAGVLIGGDDARLGGAAAAHLHGLSREPPREIEVFVDPNRRRPRADGPWTFVRSYHDRGQRVGSPPRTDATETVIDRCADPSVSDRDAIGLLTDAVQQRRTDAARLRRALARRTRHPRRRLLDELLGEVAAGVRSPLERTYLRDVERAHGLPTGRRQVARRGTEADVVYPDHGVIVELDGRLGHTGSWRFRDMARDNRSTLDGLPTLRYGFGDVTADPCAVAAQVAELLAARGWSGVPSRCARCRERVA